MAAVALGSSFSGLAGQPVREAVSQVDGVPLVREGEGEGEGEPVLYL